MQLSSHQEIRILHVDDNPSFTDLTGTFLEREDDRFAVETATSADEGMEKLCDSPPDCVVSDYNMPGMDGIGFLQSVRDEFPTLPFILYTGKGSEAVASDAIAYDATDYLQKGSGSEQYELLANRIENAVKARREAQRADRQEQLMRLTEFAGDTGGFELDRESNTVLLTAGTRRIIGRPDQYELPLGEALELFHPDDRESIQQTLEEAFETGEELHRIWRLQPDGGDERLLDLTITPVTENGEMTKLRGAGHDITDRQERQSELRLLQKAIDDANVSITLADPSQPDEPLVYVNDAFEELTGYPPEETLGHNCRFLQGEDTDPEKTTALRDAIDNEEPISIELRNYRKDGTEFWNRLTVTPIYDDDGQLVRYLGTQEDITERKERERELRAERRFIEQALDTLEDLFYVLNTDGTLRRWNKRVPELSGYTDQDLADMQAIELFPEDEHEPIGDAIETTLADGQATVEADLRTAEGERIPFEFTGAQLTDPDGNVTGMVGIGRDLTERRQRERQFRALVEKSNDITSVVDSDGQYQYQSPSLERILGHDPEETIGDTAWEYVHPDDRERITEEFETLVHNTDKVSERSEYRARHADGSWRWMEARAHDPVDNSAVGGYVINSRDITDRKEREQELERYKTFVEATGDPMYALDADGQLTVVNEAFVELTGHDRDRLIGSQPSVFTTQAAIDHAESVIQSLLSSNANRETFEFDVHTADGKRVPCECHLALLPFDEEFQGTVAVLRDVTERNRRQRELERQNDLFAKAQEMATVGAYEYEVDAEDLRWTEQVYEMHGLPTDFELSLEAVAEIYHPDDRAKLREAINQAITTGEPYDLEVRISPQNNGTRWLRTVADPQFEDGTVVRVRGTVHDITERRERERELQRQRDRYQSLFENNPLVIWEQDFSEAVEYLSLVTSDVADVESYLLEHPDEIAALMDRVEIIDVNQNAVEHYEAPSKAALLDDFDQVFTDDTLDVLAAEWAAIATGQTEFRTETVGQTFSGTTSEELMHLRVPENYAEDYSRVYVIGTDISETKARERQLQEVLERYEALFANTNDAIARIEYEDSVPIIQEANDVFRELFEPPGETVVGRNLDAVVASEGRFEEAREYSKTTADGRFMSAELTRDTVEGPREFRWQAVPLDESSNAEDGIDAYAVYTDITERIQRERELERERDRLEKFAGIVSHDLRNPLNVASTRLELASEECASTHLADAADALNRMETLIDDVLTIAREGTPVQETELVALPEMAEDCWSVVQTGEAALRIDAEHSIQAAPGRLKQLLENLVRNAIDHGGDDVTVTVGEIADGFYVADDGPGIPAKEREEVFEAGYSTTDQGTGLGLNIVKEIGEAHGWEISVTDSDDGGARFEIAGVAIA